MLVVGEADGGGADLVDQVDVRFRCRPADRRGAVDVVVAADPVEPVRPAVEADSGVASMSKVREPTGCSIAVVNRRRAGRGTGPAGRPSGGSVDVDDQIDVAAD